MQAHELIIDAKIKRHPFAIVSANDFQVRVGSPLNPRTILEQPNQSLYCLDHANRQVIFVETPPEIDLLQAPFYFIAQYEAAQRLVAVPYDTFHALAREIQVEQERIILFYSTGRCGSTLFSRVMNLEPSVVSFSEPDVFSQLVKLRTARQAGEEEVASLLADCIMLMSANAQRQGYDRYCFKFRSYVLSVSDLLYRVMPKAKLLFMYRNALTWARSFSRAFGTSDVELATVLNEFGFRYMTPSVNRFLETHSNSIRWVEHLARMWVSTMQDSRWLMQQGAPLAPARFEDLKATPQPVIQALLAHCGLPMPDAEQLALLLAKDSQAGTMGAQDKQEPARRLTDTELAELDRLVRELDPALTPDTVLS